MEVLIDQQAGFGDIFFCQKIATKLIEQGHTVYWRVIEEYQYIEEYIQNGVIWRVDNDKISSIRPLVLDHSTRYFNYPRGEIGFNVMQAKYRYANDQFGIGGFEDWQDYLKIKRNYEREAALEEHIRLHSYPKEFSVVCHHFATDYLGLEYCRGGRPISSNLPEIEITKIKGFYIFDWCGIIEKASEIRIPDSSFPYLVEILNTTNNLYMYSRNGEGEIKTKPIWKKNWEFIDDWEIEEAERRKKELVEEKK